MPQKQEPEAELDGIARLAALARLDLGADEQRALGPELARILAAFEVLSRYRATTSAAPAAHGAERTRPDAERIRPDVVRPSLAPALVLGQAPDAREGFFAVPKTVGTER